MPVFVYNSSGLVEQRSDSEIEIVGREISDYNKSNPAGIRRLFVGDQFPPANHTVDSVTGKLRMLKLSEQVSAGKINLPPGHVVIAGVQGERIVSELYKLDGSGEVVEKTTNEKIADGLVAFDPVTQKVENNQIVPKTRQELLDGGQLTHDGLRESEMQRLRLEVETYFGETKTTNGYRLDNLARQKAALSMQYRQLADTDPVKADLLSKELIYPDTICDEILAAVEVVQSAYSQAKAAVESAYTGQQSVAQYEAIQLANYIV